MSRRESPPSSHVEVLLAQQLASQLAQSLGISVASLAGLVLVAFWAWFTNMRSRRKPGALQLLASESDVGLSKQHRKHGASRGTLRDAAGNFRTRCRKHDGPFPPNNAKTCAASRHLSEATSLKGQRVPTRSHLDSLAGRVAPAHSHRCNAQ